MFIQHPSGQFVHAVSGSISNSSTMAVYAKFLLGEDPPSAGKLLRCRFYFGYNTDLIPLLCNSCRDQRHLCEYFSCWTVLSDSSLESIFAAPQSCIHADSLPNTIPWGILIFNCLGNVCMHVLIPWKFPLVCPHSSRSGHAVSEEPRFASSARQEWQKHSCPENPPPVPAHLPS